MADQDTAPLTDEERAELEALRAEKAARERAELEALRAEMSDEPEPASAPDPGQAPAAPPATPAPTPRRPERKERPVVDPEHLTRGQRMVMTPEETDEDGIPRMPPAQKIVIAICVVCAVGGAVWIALSNAGIV